MHDLTLERRKNPAGDGPQEEEFRPGMDHRRKNSGRGWTTGGRIPAGDGSQEEEFRPGRDHRRVTKGNSNHSGWPLTIHNTAKRHQYSMQSLGIK
jgi:hypothetical protein